LAAGVPRNLEVTSPQASIGRIASSNGNAMVTPMPLSKVRREMGRLVIVIEV
jgi:hypothetical protein